MVSILFVLICFIFFSILSLVVVVTLYLRVSVDSGFTVSRCVIVLSKRLRVALSCARRVFVKRYFSC